LNSRGPLLTSAQVKQVDALAHERFGIAVDWLMEAAGWQVARFCGQPAAVVCGVGNNAGDGLAAARHLHRWGRLASVCCVDADRLRGPAARELDALRRIGVVVSSELTLDNAQVIIDAIFGIGISRAPEGRFAEWIDSINASGKPVIAVDIPSGLDADTGVAYAPTVQATATVTLGLPKPGLLKADGPRLSGGVRVADIGVPFEVYEALGIDVPPGLFAKEQLVRLSGP
jgi:NAD(P)H-hydrate epimerase